MAQEYYANQYGVQLEEYLIWLSNYDLENFNYNYTTGQGFALTNALKYIVRAGKKPNEPYEKDMQKYEDYIAMAKKMGFDDYEARLWVEVKHAEFNEFKGGVTFD